MDHAPRKGSTDGSGTGELQALKEPRILHNTSQSILTAEWPRVSPTTALEEFSSTLQVCGQSKRLLQNPYWESDSQRGEQEAREPK
jgi:hypothetical protein